MVKTKSRRTAQFNIKVTPEVKAAFDALAARLHVTAPELGQLALQQALNEWKERLVVKLPTVLKRVVRK